MLRKMVITAMIVGFLASVGLAQESDSQEPVKQDNQKEEVERTEPRAQWTPLLDKLRKAYEDNDREQMGELLDDMEARREKFQQMRRERREKGRAFRGDRRRGQGRADGFSGRSGRRDWGRAYEGHRGWASRPHRGMRGARGPQANHGRRGFGQGQRRQMSGCPYIGGPARQSFGPRAGWQRSNFQGSRQGWAGPVRKGPKGQWDGCPKASPRNYGRGQRSEWEW